MIIQSASAIRRSRPPAVAGGGISNPGVETTRYTATHYVTVTGAGSHNGSLGNEWTYDEALSNAPAGAFVRVAPGIHYVESGGFSRSSPPVIQTSGTLANPIIFFAQYPAIYNEGYPQYLTQVISDGTGADNGPCVGMAGTRAYHVYDGFWYKQENGSYNNGECSALSLFLGGDVHFKLLRCLLDQENEGNTAASQNWGNVYMQQSNYIELSDCKFANLPISVNNYNDDNAQSFVVYSTGYVVVKHCEWDGVTGVMFMKGAYDDPDPDIRPWKVHHNYMHHWKQPFFMSLGAIGSINATYAGEYWDFYQNVVYHDALGATGSNLPGMAIKIEDITNGSSPRNFRIVNNTFINDGLTTGDNYGLLHVKGVESGDTNFTDAQMRNNIAIENGSQRGWSAGIWDATGVSRLDSNNNAWSGFSESIFFQDEGFNQYTRTEWQALGSGRDADSYFGSVSLTDPDNGDFTCATAALLKNAANDGVDILNLQGLGASEPINLGAFILAGQTDYIGIRPQSVTDAESLNWTYPYE